MMPNLQNNALIGIACLGGVLRFRQWLEVRSLWNDEVALAASFASKDFPAIVTEPLLYGQSAPPGFLLVTHLATQAFGLDERSLRLPALLAGIATVFLSVLVARRLLSHPSAQLLFVALVALSPTLIYYSNELKQYSFDALAVITTLLLWSFVGHRRQVPLLAVGGFLIIISSLVGIITVLSLGISFVIKCWFYSPARFAKTNHNVNRGSFGLSVLGAWVAGLVVHGLYVLSAGTDRRMMVSWWAERSAFPPQAVDFLSELEWYPLSIMRLIWIGIGEEARVGSRASTGPVLVAVIVIVLLVEMFRTRKGLRSLVLSVIACAWLLAELRIYPTSGRLSLYLVPIVLLSLSAGLDSILDKGRATRSLVAYAGVVLLLFIQADVSARFLLEPLNDRDMKWVASELDERANRSDVAIVAPGFSGKIADWYGIPAMFEPESFLIASEMADLPSGVTQGESDRIWVMSTHSTAVARAITGDLEGAGYREVCIEEFRGTYLALLLRSDLAAGAEPQALCRLAHQF